MALSVEVVTSIVLDRVLSAEVVLSFRWSSALCVEGSVVLQMVVRAVC